VRRGALRGKKEAHYYEGKTEEKRGKRGIKKLPGRSPEERDKLTDIKNKDQVDRFQNNREEPEESGGKKELRKRENNNRRHERSKRVLLRLLLYCVRKAVFFVSFSRSWLTKKRHCVLGQKGRTCGPFAPNLYEKDIITDEREPFALQTC